jgi:signal transduction histidine kinase
LQSFESQEQAVTIPVKNDTEIGLLTESFNDMSKKIWSARADLRKKISELENANKELKETQTKLVHSAKMVSLGQLVAGVAHELNNPIGFIYSNMNYLKEYSDKLIELVNIAEKYPQDLDKKKEEFDADEEAEKTKKTRKKEKEDWEESSKGYHTSDDELEKKAKEHLKRHKGEDVDVDVSDLDKFISSKTKKK